MLEQKRGYFSAEELDLSTDGYRTSTPLLSAISEEAEVEILEENKKLIYLG